MKIGISGSHGFVGQRLATMCKSLGHEVISLVRGEHDDQAHFNPWRSLDRMERLSQLDVVVHLAGRSINPPWTKRARDEMVASRLELTGELARSIASTFPRTKAFVCASAIGIYGDRGETLLDESCDLGEQGFLVDLAKAWELACGPATEAGVRVVNLRFGVILDSSGGALHQMLRPARWGLNGPLGNGQQWFSWIGLDDAVRAIVHCIDYPGLVGPVNVVAPNPVRNAEFAKTLGRTLHRPAFLGVPAFMLRLLLGDAAQELLLASVRVTPGVLLEHDFRFKDPELSALLGRVLAKGDVLG